MYNYYVHIQIWLTILKTFWPPSSAGHLAGSYLKPLVYQIYSCYYFLCILFYLQDHWRPQRKVTNMFWHLPTTSPSLLNSFPWRVSQQMVWPEGLNCSFAGGEPRKDYYRIKDENLLHRFAFEYLLISIFSQSLIS